MTAMRYDDYEDERIPQTLVAEKVVTAKVEHHCGCGNTIQPGGRYRRRFWIVDGEPTVEKLCLMCPPW